MPINEKHKQIIDDAAQNCPVMLDFMLEVCAATGNMPAFDYIADTYRDKLSPATRQRLEIAEQAAAVFGAAFDGVTRH